MENRVSFGEILEAADCLTLEEQEILLEILHHRMIERRRSELAKDIQESHNEFQNNRCIPVSPDDLMKEILS